MSFCTKCGAAVTGAFCAQCGTPVSAAASGTPAPPARRRTSPLVWVLIAIVGLFVLAGIAVVGVGAFIARHPGDALARLVTAGNPNVEIVRTDDDARTITVRDRRTGKETTVSFEDIKNGRIRITGDSGDGGTATVELGSEAKLPSWLPMYPGANEHAKFSVAGESASGRGTGGTFSFTTSDEPSDVIAFYRNKAIDAGLEITEVPPEGDGLVLVAAGKGNGRSLHVVAAPGTAVNVIFAEKR